MKQQPR